MRPSLNIAIAGAGVGGLAAASLLADDGHEVTVFDQFDAPRPVGSGLVIQPVGQAVLERIGLGEAVMLRGRPITRMRGHDASNGRRVLDVSYDLTGAGRRGLGIHRATLFDLLFSAAQERRVAMETGATIVGRDGQFLAMADGRRHGPFDLIVDACGAGSPLSPLSGQQLGYGAIWGTVDWPETELPSDELTQAYRRADRMIGVLPIGLMAGDARPKAAVFWSLPQAQYGAWRDAGLSSWKREAGTLWPAIGPFLDQITAPEQMTMARYSHGTLRRSFGEGIVHIGDAAHRASPQLGQGANMALLDALALARAIARAPLEEALPIYAQARRWHVGLYQAFSAAFTPQFQSDSRALPVLRDRVLFPLSQVSPITHVLSALVRGNMIPPLASLGDI